MTQKELIEFGHKLIAKGRTPTEIHNAISIKVSNKKELNNILEKVFIEGKTTPKRSSKKVSELLKANKLKLNFEYSQKGLIRISILILIIGGITLFLSKEEVNQNAVFGIMTIIQGVTIAILNILVKSKNLYDLLLIAVIAYFTIWIIELFIWGIPNDLIEAYNHHKMNAPSIISLQARTGGARFIGFIFPFLYLGLKLFLGWFVFDVYRNHTKYEALSQEIKDDLKAL